jgi:hypothetical protein
MGFAKAVKYASFLRMSLAGPAGAGKTFTALTLATTLADGKGVAVIDTEHGTARKYADLFTFDVDELDTFDPRNYVKSIRDAEQAGYAVLVIDSLSHAWNGKGGLLEIVDNIATRKYRGNTFSAWKDAGIIEHDFIECILTAKIHTIVTMRSKMDHVSEKNEQTGRTEVKKLGMAPIQRDTMEYEFDIIGNLDVSNTLIIQKSRCRGLSGQVIPQPDGKVIKTIRPWLEGVEAPLVTTQTSTPVLQSGEASGAPLSEQQLNSIRKLLEHLGRDEMPGLASMGYMEAKELIQQLTAEYREQKNKPVPQNATNLSDIPTVQKLRERAKALGIEWDTVLKEAFEKPISEGKATLQAIQAKGDELPPGYCQRIASYLQAKQAA